MNQYKAMDIANLLIQMGNSLHDNHIDNLKLNKMLYFAQGHCLSMYGTPLFSDPVEAWEHGPVVSEVYRAYKRYGYNRIQTPNYHVDQKTLDPALLKILLDVYRVCLDCTGGDLEGISHAIEGPWRTVYQDGVNNQIHVEEMLSYFQNHGISELISPTLPTRYTAASPEAVRTASDKMNKRWPDAFRELAK